MNVGVVASATGTTTVPREYLSSLPRSETNEKEKYERRSRWLVEGGCCDMCHTLVPEQTPAWGGGGVFTDVKDAKSTSSKDIQPGFPTRKHAATATDRCGDLKTEVSPSVSTGGGA